MIRNMLGMTFSNMLVIEDGSQETFFGVLTIIVVISLIYTFAFVELSHKKISKAKEAKRVAVEGLNRKKIREKYEEAEEEVG